MNSVLWFGAGLALQGLVFWSGYQIGKIQGLRGYLRYLENRHKIVKASSIPEEWDYKPKQRNGNLDGAG